MAKKPKFNLLDYVKIRLDDATITLEVIVPLTRWPEPLYDEYGAIVRMLTAPEPGEALLEYSQHVAFCRDVRRSRK